MSPSLPQPIQILLVDDDPGDILLTRRTLEKGKVFNSLMVASDGVEALQILRREGLYRDAVRPDLILMDLNMPRMNGWETLEAIKNDAELRDIPVVILTTANVEQDVLQSDDRLASCFVTKPVELTDIMRVVASIQDFWLCLVRTPAGEAAGSTRRSA